MTLIVYLLRTGSKKGTYGQLEGLLQEHLPPSHQERLKSVRGHRQLLNANQAEYFTGKRVADRTVKTIDQWQ